MPPNISSSSELKDVAESYKDRIFKQTNKLLDKSLEYMGFKIQKL